MERNRRLLEYLFHISLFFFFFSKRNYGNSTLKFHDSQETCSSNGRMCLKSQPRIFLISKISNTFYQILHFPLGITASKSDSRRMMNPLPFDPNNNLQVLILQKKKTLLPSIKISKRIKSTKSKRNVIDAQNFNKYRMYKNSKVSKINYIRLIPLFFFFNLIFKIFVQYLSQHGILRK